MSTYTDTFERCELKYLLDERQYAALRRRADAFMRPDRFGESTVCSLYYDTPDRRIIRASLARPVYKEKLRLRCYGVPENDRTAFAELKKKYDGIVCKRRAVMTYEEAVAYFAGAPAPADSQITRELDYTLSRYPGLAPAMCICCDRTAFFAQDDPNLRMTYDANIRWRETQLDLTAGALGERLLPPGVRLLEVKIASAMPLWLAHALSESGIYPVSFSKYGRAYLSARTKVQHRERSIYCA